jgi:hypothetical protein
MSCLFVGVAVSNTVSVLAGGAVPNCCVTQICKVAGVVFWLGVTEYQEAGAEVENVMAPAVLLTETLVQSTPPGCGMLTEFVLTVRVCANPGAAKSKSRDGNRIVL